MPFGYCGSLIHEYFLNTFCVSGTVPSSGNSDEEKALLSRSLNFSWGGWALNSEQINEQKIYSMAYAMKKNKTRAPGWCSRLSV